MKSKKLEIILQKYKPYVKKCKGCAWSRRHKLIFIFLIFFLSYKLWYKNVPKEEPSMLCSFGRGIDTIFKFPLPCRKLVSSSPLISL